MFSGIRQISIIETSFEGLIHAVSITSSVRILRILQLQGSVIDGNGDVWSM